MRFELEHLESYDDESLLAEVRRVAAFVATPRLTRDKFNEHAKVYSSTLEKRFGSWKAALSSAGLGERYDDSGAKRGRDEILAAIKAVAGTVGGQVLTLNEFTAHAGIGGDPVRRIFGSWANALAAAGLEQSSLGKRYSDEECFENMLAVWTHHGGPPRHDDMNEAPSVVGSKAYIRRWGTWRKALAAFVHRVNHGEATVHTPAEAEHQVCTGKSCDRDSGASERQPPRGTRDVPLALRYYVLRRDHFRCVACGASPAISPGIILHVDHIHPWARGGATVADNLRTLCQACNLGKGASPA